AARLPHAAARRRQRRHAGRPHPQGPFTGAGARAVRRLRQPAQGSRHQRRADRGAPAAGSRSGARPQTLMPCQFVRRSRPGPDRMSVPRPAGLRGSGRGAAAAPARGLLSSAGVSRLAALAVLLAPAAALAQTPSITVKTQGTLTHTVTLGLDECSNNRQIVFRWDLNTPPAGSDMVKIFISKATASCSAAPEPPTAPPPPLIQPTSANASDQATVSTRQLLLDLQNGCANT